MLINKNIKIISKYFLAPAVFLFLSYSIYRQLLQHQHWEQSIRQIWEGMKGPRHWRLWMVLLLMPVNWGLEARKWQLSIRSLQVISFWNAFKATLTGTTMASFTPNRIGEYAGRILYVEEGKRIPAISLTIVCSMAQLLVTLWTGCAGVFYCKTYYQHPAVGVADSGDAWLNLLLWSAALCATLLTMLYFRLSRLVKLVGKMSFPTRWMGYVKVLADFPANILHHILFLSFARWTVFILQYFLLFSVFGVYLNAEQVVGGVSVLFLVMAIVPSFTFLTELGLRGEASIQIIQLFSSNTIGIFAASLGIWLVNLIIPALVGSLLILSLKLFGNR